MVFSTAAEGQTPLHALVSPSANKAPTCSVWLPVRSLLSCSGSGTATSATTIHHHFFAVYSISSVTVLASFLSLQEYTASLRCCSLPFSKFRLLLARYQVPALNTISYRHSAWALSLLASTFSGYAEPPCSIPPKRF